MSSNHFKRKTNQETIGDAIERMLKVYRLKSGLTETILRSDWQDIVGPVIAGHTDELILRGKKLIIKVNSAALKHELHYQREDIARIVNDHLKEQLIEEVVLQ